MLSKQQRKEDRAQGKQKEQPRLNRVPDVTLCQLLKATSPSSISRGRSANSICDILEDKLSGLWKLLKLGMGGAWHEVAYQDRRCFCQTRTQGQVKSCLFQGWLQLQHLAWCLAKVFMNEWVNIREYKCLWVQGYMTPTSPSVQKPIYSASPQFQLSLLLLMPPTPPNLKFLTQNWRYLCCSVTWRSSNLSQS